MELRDIQQTLTSAVVLRFQPLAAHQTKHSGIFWWLWVLMCHLDKCTHQSLCFSKSAASLPHLLMLINSPNAFDIWSPFSSHSYLLMWLWLGWQPSKQRRIDKNKSAESGSEADEAGRSSGGRWAWNLSLMTGAMFPSETEQLWLVVSSSLSSILHSICLHNLIQIWYTRHFHILHTSSILELVATLVKKTQKYRFYLSSLCKVATNIYTET